MAGVFTSDDVVPSRLGFHNVERDGQIDPSMNAMRAMRLQMDPNRMHAGHESVAARAARLRRAAEDLEEITGQESMQQHNVRPILDVSTAPTQRRLPSAALPVVTHRGPGALTAPQPAAATEATQEFQIQTPDTLVALQARRGQRGRALSMPPMALAVPPGLPSH